MKQISDNRGNTFRSAAALCRWYRIDYQSYVNCVRLGYSVSEIIESVEANYGKCKAHDHKGNGYKNYKELCEAYDIPYMVFKTRYNNLGWSLEDSLETPLKEDKYTRIANVNKGGRVYDHKGNMYESFVDMCEAYDIDPVLVESRMRCHEWPLEDALTRRKGQRKPKRKQLIERGTFRERFAYLFGEDGRSITDHHGKVFANYKIMCETYGISSATFCQRIERGWDLGTALESPAKVSRHNDVVVKGKRWETVADFCNEVHIDKERYFYLKKSGQWDVIEKLAA